MAKDGEMKTAAIRHSVGGCPPGTKFQGGKCVDIRTGKVVQVSPRDRMKGFGGRVKDKRAQA